ncbi:hypothetical protein KAW38_00440 [Candidatus Micrarchaeota archaeon]|nr:hypothetical protein [Candidatus Micrarchaeota archaeon]
MKKLVFLFSLFLLLNAIEIDFYYGEGCPHCKRTLETFGELSEEYPLEINAYNVYTDKEKREEFIKAYYKFGADINRGGVPTIIVENTTFVIGEMEEKTWRFVFKECIINGCPEGIYTENSLIEMELTRTGPSALTLPTLFGAALVDSVNPCTIAVMAMLLAVVLVAKGRKEMLISGTIFFLTIYAMYFLMGIGILNIIENTGIREVFLGVVTVGALVLAAMEINAYFYYKPGFWAVEMPGFLRPHAKAFIENATTHPGVFVAAMFCSLFLIPCSSGPYLMVLAMIAEGSVEGYLYLALYNAVFILPMVAITLLIYMNKTTVTEVQKYKEKHIRGLHLFSGIVLFMLFLFLVWEFWDSIRLMIGF